MGYVTCWDPTSCPNILKGPQREKTPSQNLLSAWPAAQVSPKRLSEGFPLRFAFSRHQLLTLPNFLTLHHKSKCCFSSMIYVETGPKVGCKVQLGKLRNFRIELLSLPVPQCIGYTCKAPATNEHTRCRHSPLSPHYVILPIFSEIVS